MEVFSLPTATVLHAAREEKHLPHRLLAGQGFLARHPAPIIYILTAQQLKKKKNAQKGASENGCKMMPIRDQRSGSVCAPSLSNPLSISVTS